MTPDRSMRPWVVIASMDAREWWRDHPGASLEEYAEWVYRRYEPLILVGLGATPVGQWRLTAVQRDVLDAVHEGLALGARSRRERAA